jgi:anti-sigma28 factor (negative regulator of flagellin synthesis)
MMNVNGIQPAVPANAVDAAGAVNNAQPVTDPNAAPDVVEISTAARLSSKVADVPEVRTDLIERVKAEIAAGTYETPERLDATADRLLKDLLGG